MNKNEGVCVCEQESSVCVCVEAIYDNRKDAYHDYNHSRLCFWMN